jgi:hypothetical protein
MESPQNDIFYVLENSDWFCRFFCQAIHPFQMTMSSGPTAGGVPIATYERPLRCAAQNCKCCCYQEIFVNDAATGQRLGSVTETFYICVPTFQMKDAQENVSHLIHLPVCCLGMCPYICAEGCCRVPFYIYPAKDYNYEKHDGKIVRLWGSLFTELIGVHQFQCEFPKYSTPEQKAVVMGGTFLLNELFFKKGSHGN